MTPRRVLITGADGMLARALAHVLHTSASPVVALPKSSLDVTDEMQTARVVRDHKPAVVLHCAAFTRVDDAELEEAQAWDVNARGTANIAAACRTVGARLVYPSTDYVFDGTASVPYRPDAALNPINAYGRSKAAGEDAARAAGDFLIVRTSWLYGAGGRNFVRTIAERIARHERLRVVTDQRGSPTWAIDLARVMVGLVERRASAGVYHASNAGEASWYELACEVARLRGSSVAVEGCATGEFQARARRPAFSVLDCSKTERLLGPMRPWQMALAEAVRSGAY